MSSETVERVHALEIEGHREIAGLSGLANLIDGSDELVAVGCENPSTECGERLDCVAPVHYVVADIDAQVMNTGILPDLQFAEIDTGVGPEPRMIVPYDPVTKELICRKARVVGHPFHPP